MASITSNSTIRYESSVQPGEEHNSVTEKTGPEKIPTALPRTEKNSTIENYVRNLAKESPANKKTESIEVPPPVVTGHVNFRTYPSLVRNHKREIDQISGGSSQAESAKNNKSSSGIFFQNDKQPLSSESTVPDRHLSYWTGRSIDRADLSNEEKFLRNNLHLKSTHITDNFEGLAYAFRNFATGKKNIEEKHRTSKRSDLQENGSMSLNDFAAEAIQRSANLRQRWRLLHTVDLELAEVGKKDTGSKIHIASEEKIDFGQRAAEVAWVQTSQFRLSNQKTSIAVSGNAGYQDFGITSFASFVKDLARNEPWFEEHGISVEQLQAIFALETSGSGKSAASASDMARDVWGIISGGWYKDVDTRLTKGTVGSPAAEYGMLLSLRSEIGSLYGNMYQASIPGNILQINKIQDLLKHHFIPGHFINEIFSGTTDALPETIGESWVDIRPILRQAELKAMKLDQSCLMLLKRADDRYWTSTGIKTPTEIGNRFKVTMAVGGPPDTERTVMEAGIGERISAVKDGVAQEFNRLPEAMNIESHRPAVKKVVGGGGTYKIIPGSQRSAWEI